MAMRAVCLGILAVVWALSGVSQTRSANKNSVNKGSDKDKLIGAWRLATIAAGSGESHAAMNQPKGILIYTADGHMSVQLMYPVSANAQSNEYVQDGYEASFGSYDVDEAKHTVTHHVQGSNTRDRLVGKDLPRLYQFTEDGRLIIRSTRPDEHWSVTWEHY